MSEIIHEVTHIKHNIHQRGPFALGTGDAEARCKLDFNIWTSLFPSPGTGLHERPDSYNKQAHFVMKYSPIKPFHFIGQHK